LGKLGVKSVEIETVPSWNQRQRHFGVRAKFVWGAGFAGVIAGHSQTAAQFAAEGLEAAHVIALPAMERDGHFGQGMADSVSIHPEGGVAFASQFIRGRNIFWGAHLCRAIRYHESKTRFNKEFFECRVAECQFSLRRADLLLASLHAF
jgi:hypothetical protein